MPQHIINALVIPADEDNDIHVEQIERSDVYRMKEIVGGYFALLPIREEDCFVVLNEHAYPTRLPINHRATVIIKMLTWTPRSRLTLRGDCFIVGQGDGIASAPQELIDVLTGHPRLAIEVRVTKGTVWLRAEDTTYDDWMHAYAKAFSMQHSWGLINAIRVVVV